VGTIGQSGPATAGFGGASAACFDRDDPRRFICSILPSGGANALVDGLPGARGEFD
jgi:hypothetical protein